MLEDLVAGLEIIKTYSEGSPVICLPYMITVPAVLQVDMTGPDQTAIELLGWLLHPVYESYYYPSQTITELADVTGEGDGEFVMPLPPLIPPSI